jgi:hypothetical protein
MFGRSAGLLAVGGLVCVLLGGTCGGEQGVAGDRKCSRQTDCMGGEACDPASGRCVDDSSLASGGPGTSSSQLVTADGSVLPQECRATLPGCVDDALLNRAVACAEPLEPGGAYRDALVLCPTTVDHFRVVVPAAGALQVLAWPSTPVDIALNAGVDGGPTFTESGETRLASLVSHVAGVMAAPADVVTRLSANTTAGYALQVLAGATCATDADCPTQRCDPLLVDPNDNRNVLLANTTRGGVCVGATTSPCGDTTGLPRNTRGTAANLLLGANPTPLETCLRDVDWYRAAFDLEAINLTITVACSSSDPAFRPLVALFNNAGTMEWQVVFADWVSGSDMLRTLRHVPGGPLGSANGAHFFMVRQVAGLAGGGNCTLKLTGNPVSCTSNADCNTSPENVRMGRTLCSLGACIPG